MSSHEGSKAGSLQLENEKTDVGYTSRSVDTLDEIEEKRLIRKIDWRLVPILGALYSIALIDRTNISAARVAGMGPDLALHVGDRWTIVLVMFFPCYLLLEFPSNILLRKVGAANLLSFTAFAWGLVIIGQGFTHSWIVLTVCRILLGAFEAGFFPGCVYLITCWYKRFEVQKRLGVFYLFSVAMGGVSNVLAFGLMQMEGVCGLRGWRWIFIIEGILTCVVAILSYFIIVDFPDKAAKTGFLTESEATYILQRLEDDRGDSMSDPLTRSKFVHYLGDLKLWAFGTLMMATTVPTYALANFLPIIMLGMGYSPGVSNALSCPPAFAALASALGFAWVGDKYHLRAPIIAAQCILTIIGLMVTAYSTNNGVRYFGLFLGICGSQGNIPSVLAYQSNNIVGQSKRSVGSALQISFGAIGGIIASTVFREKDAPRYVIGLWVTAGMQFLMLAVVGTLSMVFWKKNKKADSQRASGQQEDPIEGRFGFRYTL